jgi:hypothetical protein
MSNQCGVVDEDGCKLYDILCCINRKQKERGNKRESQMNQVRCMLCALTLRLSFQKQNTNRCCCLGPCKQHQSHLKNYIVAAERKNGGNVLKTTELGKFTVSDMGLAFSCNVRIVKGKDTDPSDVTGILA